MLISWLTFFFFSQNIRESLTEFDGSMYLRSIEFKLHEIDQNNIKMSWLYEVRNNITII